MNLLSFFIVLVSFLSTVLGFTQKSLLNPLKSRFFTSKLNVAKTYSVKVINKKKNTAISINVPSDKFILDSAEDQAVPIPYSCRAGACSSCIGMMKSGKVDQSGNIFLSNKLIDEGYVLTCVAYPQSDMEVEVDIEAEFYNMNPDLKVE